jgi:hypothetical protein
MTEPYAETAAETVASYRVTHQTDEETHVVVLDLGTDAYLALALDYDSDGDLLDAEEIVTARTQAEAETRAADWMAENPKGIGSGPGVTDLFG